MGLSKDYILDRMVLLLFISMFILTVLSIDLPSGLFELSILLREICCSGRYELSDCLCGAKECSDYPAQTAKYAVRSEFIRSAVINAKGANRFVRAQNRYFRSFKLAKST